MLLRKQFLLTNSSQPEYQSEYKLQVGGFTLYADHSLSIENVSSDKGDLVLIGDIYSYQEPNWSNEEILRDSINHFSGDFTSDLRLFDSLCGSYVAVWLSKKDSSIKIFTDMVASREVFYGGSASGLIAVGSQPSLVDQVIEGKLDESLEAEIFFDSKAFETKKVFPGDKTGYSDIKRLKANYFLKLDDLEIHRYFPCEELGVQNVEAAAIKCGSMIRGFILSASKRQRLLLGISGGWESRVLLAASKPVSKKSSYFVFKHSGYTDQHPDIRIPKQLLSKLNLKLNVISYESIDDSTLVELEDEMSFPRKNVHSYAKNGISKFFPGHTLVNGNISEIARMEWDDIVTDTAEKAAYMEKYHGLSYAIDAYSKWINESSSLFKQKGFRHSDMLYWEENCCNWAGKTNTEVRMYSEIFQPFNCRELILTMLSVDKRFRRKQRPRLHYLMIKSLWPECLNAPINPGFKKVVIKFLQIIGVYGVYRKLLLHLMMRIKKPN